MDYRSRALVMRLGSTLRQYASTPSQQPYDVVIVGGGMVGMALAAALGTDRLAKTLSVAVLDRAPVKDTLSESLPAVPEARVSTVTPSSMRLFQNMGAWPDISAPNSRTFNDMQVWDASGSGVLRWNAQDVGAEVMGSVAENHVIQSACYRAAKGAANVDFLWPSSVSSMKLPAYRVDSSASAAASGDSAPGSLAEISLSDGTHLRARLVVAADGARSNLRSLAGLRTMSLAYKQHGLVATVACDHNDTAWQRFLPTGPIALLPVRDGYSNIVWSTTPEHAARLAGMTAPEFGDAVNEALQASAPSTAPDLSAWLSGGGGHPKSTPPRVHGYVRPRFALIGDAAHAVHPLAGQGVNLGFGDVSQMLTAISGALETGQDVGDLAMLQARYERPRLVTNTAMMAGLHTLQRVYGSQSQPVVGVRNLGMALIDRVGPVRNQLMQIAMGNAGS